MGQWDDEARLRCFIQELQLFKEKASSQARDDRTFERLVDSYLISNSAGRLIKAIESRQLRPGPSVDSDRMIARKGTRNNLTP